jgi:hypothetical protein
MNAYYLEPCMQLNNEELARLALALQEIEKAVHKLNAPNGLRVFDAYITTTSPDLQYAGDTFIVKYKTNTKNKQIRRKRKKWWSWRRDR